MCHLQQHTATHCNTLQHTATHCNTSVFKGLISRRCVFHSTKCKFGDSILAGKIVRTLIMIVCDRRPAHGHNAMDHHWCHIPVTVDCHGYCNTLQHTATHCNTIVFTTGATFLSRSTVTVTVSHPPPFVPSSSSSSLFFSSSFAITLQ